MYGCRKTGEDRPLTGPVRRGDRQLMGLGCVRQRRTPPKGMFLNHDDLTLLASAPPQAENVTLQSLEKEVHDVQCRVRQHTVHSCHYFVTVQTLSVCCMP